MKPAVRQLLLSSGFDQDATALFGRMAVAPSLERKRAINTLVRSLKRDSIWGRLDAFYMHAAHDAQAARLNWVANQFNSTLVGTPTFTADAYYAGNKLDQALATGFTPSTAAGKYTQNDAGFGAYALAGLSDATSGNQIDIGAQGGGFNSYTGRSSGAGELAAMNDAGLGATVLTQNKLGMWSRCRSASGTYKTYAGRHLVETVTSTSTGLPSGAFRLLASTASFWSERPVVAAWIGGALTDSQMAAFSDAVEAYLRTIRSASLKDISIVCHGNSLTAGAGSSAGSDWPSQLRTALGAVATVDNHGTNGITTPQLTTELGQAKAKILSQRPAKRKVLIVWEVRNDMSVNGVDPAAAVANLWTYCGTARSLGYDQIYVCNLIPNGQADPNITPQDTADVNALLASQYGSYCNGLIDLTTDARLQNPLDLTYFDADKLHLTDAGYTVVKGIVQAYFGY